MKNVHMCYIRVTEGKVENLKNEGKIRISTLIFNFTIHFSCLKVCTIFIILNQVVAEKIMKNVHMCYIGVTEGKNEKEDKMSFSIFIFIYIHTLSLPVGVRKI